MSFSYENQLKSQGKHEQIVEFTLPKPKRKKLNDCPERQLKI
jgi:hypothetical protein